MYGKLCSLYYDLQEQHAPEEEINFYAQFIKPGQTVLEGMSGSGRLQIPLLQRGYSVDGIDSSPNMLNRCRQQCDQLGLTPSLYEQSLQTMSLKTLYTVIFIAKGSFQLIADKNHALQALQKMRNHMHKDGTLLIDIFTPHQQTSLSHTNTINVDKQHQIRFSAQYHFNEHQKSVQVFCTYELLAHSITQEQESEVMNFVWYTDNELIDLLRQADFQFIQIHEISFFPGDRSRIIEARAK